MRRHEKGHKRSPAGSRAGKGAGGPNAERLLASMEKEAIRMIERKVIMERGRALTYDEFTALAQENYAKGGNVGVECWDEEIFDYYVKEFGPVTKTKALRMFERWKSEEREQEAMMFGWGEK